MTNSSLIRLATLVPLMGARFRRVVTARKQRFGRSIAVFCGSPSFWRVSAWASKTGPAVADSGGTQRQ